MNNDRHDSFSAVGARIAPVKRSSSNCSVEVIRQLGVLPHPEDLGINPHPADRSFTIRFYRGEYILVQS